jgi:hypothetical protein
MTTMLERMRARVQERAPQFEKDYSIYAFWNLKFGGSSTLRLLPFNDPYTGGFWTEKVMLPMQFTDHNDPEKVVKFMAPCREMYDHANKCPILVPVRELYDEEKELRNSGNTKEADKLKKIAGFHWKKPTFYYQGFVNKSGMAEEETPENPIRVFPFNKKIHQIIYNSIFHSDEDPYETLPCGEFTQEDVEALLGDGDVDMSIFDGYNFIVKKLQQDKWADWTTGSNWSKSQSPLTDEQLAAIAEYKLHDLTKRLPDRPSEEQYEVLAEMMTLSVNRQLTGEVAVWNTEWEALGFKPFRQRGEKSESEDSQKKSSAPASTEEGAGAGSALDRLKAARGKTTEAPVTDDESPAEVAAAADTEVEVTEVAVPEEAGETQVSDLAAKIKARVGKKSA